MVWEMELLFVLLYAFQNISGVGGEEGEFFIRNNIQKRGGSANSFLSFEAYEIS